MLCKGDLLWCGSFWTCWFQHVDLIILYRLPSSPCISLFGSRLYWWGADFLCSDVCVSGLLGYAAVYQAKWTVFGWLWPPNRRGLGLLPGWLLASINWLLYYSRLYPLYILFALQWITICQLIYDNCCAVGYFFGSALCVHDSTLIFSLRAGWFTSFTVLGISWIFQCRHIAFLQSYYLLYSQYQVLNLPPGTPLILGLLMLPMVLADDETVCCKTLLSPSFLLSPFPVFLHAQNHMTVAVGSSWYLVYFRASGNEVKGLYLCACDEILTEAFPVHILAGVYWFLTALYMTRGLPARVIPGCNSVRKILQVSMEPPLYRECMPSIWLNVHLMKPAAFNPSADTPLYLDMYSSDLVECNLFHVLFQAPRSSYCIQQYYSCCIYFCNLIEPPPFAGYGLCYCAPVWHHRMPGPALSGLDIHKVFYHVPGACAVAFLSPCPNYLASTCGRINCAPIQYFPLSSLPFGFSWPRDQRRALCRVFVFLCC